MAPEITILDSVHCKANKAARALILPLLEYKKTAWKRNMFGHRAPTVVLSYLITGRSGSSGTFLTGLLPKIRNKFDNKIKIIGQEESIKPNQKPRLKKIKFRQDQIQAFEAIKKNQRGTIIRPTGSGKTIIALGIISMFPHHRTLFLCHTKELIDQTEAAIKKYLEVDPYIIGAGHKANWDTIYKNKKPIVLSTIQSFAKIPKSKYIDFFDITIVDECHHVNNLNSQYGQIMTSNLSPCKIGLTATEPTSKQELLINEGLLGPPIAKLTVQEGIKTGIISKPIINLVPIPLQSEIDIACGNSYAKYYEYGIVKNRRRNIAILHKVKQNLKNKESTLIIIERTEHGKIIQKILKAKKIKVKFVHGNSSREKRARVKEDLKSKKILVVICSKIWREGVNIPTLNNIINACGMKEEKMIIQAIGRGLRTTKNKKVVSIIDFLDPYRYLAEHSIARIQTYINQGWLKWNKDNQ